MHGPVSVCLSVCLADTSTGQHIELENGRACSKEYFGPLESSQRERCKLPQGVWGEAPADNDFLEHLERLFLALYFRDKLKTTLCVN